MGEREQKEAHPQVETKYFVNCLVDGKQPVPPESLQRWSPEVAEILGKKTYITANCPICHSTLEAHKMSPKPSRKR